jgi:hypothetical protein
MIFNPEFIVADCDPDDAGLLAMKAALRDLKVVMRKSGDYPRRGEMLGILGEARVRIDRINKPAT